MNVRFFVHGDPRSQGSTRAFIVKGRAVTTNKTPGLDTWRKTIAAAAQPHAHMFEGPVVVALHFHLGRPQSLPKKRLSYATKKPDLDCLVRSCLDALTAVMFRDDAQVVQIVATKGYARPGARIGVEVMVGQAHEGFGTTGEPEPSKTAEGGA